VTAILLPECLVMWDVGRAVTVTDEEPLPAAHPS
jgi:hypothetical protein